MEEKLIVGLKKKKQNKTKKQNKNKNKKWRNIESFGTKYVSVIIQSEVSRHSLQRGRSGNFKVFGQVGSTNLRGSVKILWINWLIDWLSF